MLGSSTMLPRHLALAVSALAHATFAAAVVGGHAPETSGKVAPADTVLEVTILPSPEAPTEAKTTDATETRPHAHALPTHHHPFPVPPDHDAHPHDPSASHAAIPAPSKATEATPVVAPPAETSAPVRFDLPGGKLSTTGHAPGAAEAGHDDHEASAPPPVETLPENRVSERAKLLGSSPAIYPREARDAQIEADVPVAIVVDENGRVVEAQAASKSGFGLDEAAVRAIRGYRFSPAARDGKRVRVRMRWTVQFRLH